MENSSSSLHSNGDGWLVTLRTDFKLTTLTICRDESNFGQIEASASVDKTVYTLILNLNRLPSGAFFILTSS